MIQPLVETIARAVGGDEVAQHALYDTYHSTAYRLAYLLLGDGGDAEEVVQDAFVYALANLGRYDADRASFWGWLRIILVSRCRNKRRRRQLILVPLEVLAQAARLRGGPESDDPVRSLELSYTRAVLWEAVREVSPGARDALVLRFYEGLSYKEISAILGCSPDAARARVAHGKVQLRRLLTDADTGIAPAAQARPSRAT